MILKEILKSKIHSATITKTVLEYSGSIGIDKVLLLKSNILPGEKVHVLNFRTGQRFETYVIEETEGSGDIVLYGPAAHCGEVGDKVIILSYVLVTDEEKITPKIVFVDDKNCPI